MKCAIRLGFFAKKNFQTYVVISCSVPLVDSEHLAHVISAQVGFRWLFETPRYNYKRYILPFPLGSYPLIPGSRLSFVRCVVFCISQLDQHIQLVIQFYQLRGIGTCTMEIEVLRIGCFVYGRYVQCIRVKSYRQNAATRFTPNFSSLQRACRSRILSNQCLLISSNF